jgi:hypothetical protein
VIGKLGNKKELSFYTLLIQNIFPVMRQEAILAYPPQNAGLSSNMGSILPTILVVSLYFSLLTREIAC